MNQPISETITQANANLREAGAGKTIFVTTAAVSCGCQFIECYSAVAALPEVYDYATASLLCNATDRDSKLSRVRESRALQGCRRVQPARLSLQI